jgi:hypothetical protein
MAQLTEHQGVFDPEKVERYTIGHASMGITVPIGRMIPEQEGGWIRASDFDQLLALCRIQREIIEKVAAPAVKREYDRLPADVRAISDILYKQYVEEMGRVKLEMKDEVK